ncbi:hypothetical protein EDM54_01500 [Brevibacillus borstelensis]|uniref:hypothetical protein n=1 Tax=Brevibacillus borstelensis TaxID=45462 RepID=UPI00057C21AF|nr:hypothetical protein [Brevibacillus borstelensis]MED1881093.1 hypothetical protein [Brevibacillus borstelensis]MED2006727.1 hypothetical protein [Brevibacillus borstelensis]RNB66375.1 hypothetical protein EDM54_01500 [Brevibacillus borstelensis]GED53510.1 hypothetical protein BBO01nite_27510 [Brevibacillus borstelensis]
MQKPNNALDDFYVFMSHVDAMCQSYGLNREDYSTPADLFRAVVAKVPIYKLLCLDEWMGDDYLRDDILGIMHRAVRERLAELASPVGTASPEGRQPACVEVV